MSDSKSGSANNQEPVVQDPKTKDTVSHETYMRVLAEAKKNKDKAKELQDAMDKANEKTLQEQNQWKTLADSYKSQLDQTKVKLDDQEKSIVNGMKYQEFEKHLGGRLKDRDYATFIEFEKIAINPETNTIDSDSVKGVVADFVKKHSGLVEFTNSAKMPNQAPKSATFGPKPVSEMTSDEIANELKKLGSLT